MALTKSIQAVFEGSPVSPTHQPVPADATQLITEITDGTITQLFMPNGTMALPGLACLGGVSGFRRVNANSFTAVTDELDVLNFTASQGVEAIGLGGLGYGAGAGGSVTQATSKATGVTLNTPAGRVTTHAAALAANTIVRFVVTNSVLTNPDVPVLAVQSPVSKYRVWVDAVAAGSFTIALENTTGGSLSEAVVINFAIIKNAII